MYNKVIQQGNCTRDIEIKYTNAGKAVANTGIAVNRKWKDASGQQKEEAMFIDLTFWGKTAEIANTYLKKGSKILVDGSIVFQTWTDSNGAKRSKHSINVENLQMLDSKADSQTTNQEQHQNNYGGQQQQGGYVQPQQNQGYGQPQAQQHIVPDNTHEGIPEIDISDDEIPF